MKKVKQKVSKTKKSLDKKKVKGGLCIFFVINFRFVWKNSKFTGY